jgi:hypothetical protein
MSFSVIELTTGSVFLVPSIHSPTESPVGKVGIRQTWLGWLVWKRLRYATGGVALPSITCVLRAVRTYVHT